MTNPQLEAARKVMNAYRATIKLDVTENDDGSETLTPYLVADPERRGTPVTVTSSTPAAEIRRLFSESLRSVLQGA